MCVTRDIILIGTGVPDHQECQEWLLDSAHMKRSCAPKSALADCALPIELMLLSSVRANDSRLLRG